MRLPRPYYIYYDIAHKNITIEQGMDKCKTRKELISLIRLLSKNDRKSVKEIKRIIQEKNIF